jgi:two-component system KDP operon response regulator KdpE
MQTPRVLLVEDEQQIRHFVGMALTREGWQVIEADSLAQGVLAAGTQKPDLIVLDLGLPDGDGLNLIREVRAWSDVPILILSARFHEQARIDALDAGADDYLSKPFGVGEMLARLRALLRRRTRMGQDASPAVVFGANEVDLSLRRVFHNGQEVHLTQIEYRLLCALIRQPGKVMTQKSLLREVWGPTFEDSSHYLRIYVSRLRQKLELDATQPRHFLTEIGVGYRFQQ